MVKACPRCGRLNHPQSQPFENFCRHVWICGTVEQITKVSMSEAEAAALLKQTAIGYEEKLDEVLLQLQQVSPPLRRVVYTE